MCRCFRCTTGASGLPFVAVAGGVVAAAGAAVVEESTFVAAAKPDFAAFASIAARTVATAVQRSR